LALALLLLPSFSDGEEGCLLSEIGDEELEVNSILESINFVLKGKKKTKN
jgi:hypothetical protein